MSVAAGGLVLSPPVSIAQALTRTPPQVTGPFYPDMKPLDQDADLTVIEGRTARAAGQVLHIMGRLLDRNARPIVDAHIEIWQANTHGRYSHPRDRNPAPLDPNFQGYTSLMTDSEGRYRFKTIKPGAYPQSAEIMRPPHIHFEIASKRDHLVTQMYFPDEPLNENDIFLRRAGADAKRLIVSLRAPTPEMEPDSKLGVWDIVLGEG